MTEFFSPPRSLFCSREGPYWSPPKSWRLPTSRPHSLIGPSKDHGEYLWCDCTSDTIGRRDRSTFLQCCPPIELWTIPWSWSDSQIGTGRNMRKRRLCPCPRFFPLGGGGANSDGRPCMPNHRPRRISTWSHLDISLMPSTLPRPSYTYPELNRLYLLSSWTYPIRYCSYLNYVLGYLLKIIIYSCGENVCHFCVSSFLFFLH